MLRRIFIITNALIFGWVQTAFAMKVDQTDLAMKFFKESGITQHDVSVKEMYEKFGKILPESTRVQMEQFVKENPNMMIPKMDVKKVKVKGEDQFQFNINSPQGSLVVTTQNSKEVFATVVGTYEGKNVKSEIPNKLFMVGDRVVHEIRKDLDKKKVHLLSSEEFSKLTPADQITYMKHIRRLLEASEKVQNAFGRTVTAASAFSVWDLAVEQALAGEGDDVCIVAGNFSKWKTKCSVNNEFKGNGKNGCRKTEIICNPKLYGDGACAPINDLAHATHNCNKDGDPDFSKFAAKKEFGSGMEIDALKMMLSDLTTQCDKIIDVRKNDNQTEACNELKGRVSDLIGVCEDTMPQKGVTPRDMSKIKDKIKCPPKDPEECNYIGDFVGCSKYTLLKCAGKDAKYCSACEEKKYTQTLITGTQGAVSCVPKPPDDKPAKLDDGKKPDEKKPEEEGFFAGLWKSIKGFWSDNKSWLGPTLGLFGMMWFGYYVNKSNQSQQFGQQYNALYGAQPAAPVAAPPLPTVNPVLNPGTPVGAAR